MPSLFDTSHTRRRAKRTGRGRAVSRDDRPHPACRDGEDDGRLRAAKQTRKHAYAKAPIRLVRMVRRDSSPPPPASLVASSFNSPIRAKPDGVCRAFDALASSPSCAPVNRRFKRGHVSARQNEPGVFGIILRIVTVGKRPRYHCPVFAGGSGWVSRAQDPFRPADRGPARSAHWPHLPRFRRSWAARTACGDGSSCR